MVYARRGLCAASAACAVVGVAEREIALVAGLFLGVGAFGLNLRSSQWDTDFRGGIIYVPLGPLPSKARQNFGVSKLEGAISLVT